MPNLRWLGGSDATDPPLAACSKVTSSARWLSLAVVRLLCEICSAELCNSVLQPRQ